MPRNLRDVRLEQRSRQLTQGYELQGFWKGVVEEDKDPYGLGRMRVRVFAANGNLEKTPTENLPWASVLEAGYGSFKPPEKYDRVWVIFEGHDRHKPVIVGHWYGIPAGLGTVNPHNIRQGTEVPREVWRHDWAHPQAMSLHRSWEGNQVWFEDYTLGPDLYSAVKIQDAGGKNISAQTIFLGKRDYDPFQPETTRYRTKEIERDSQREATGDILLSTGDHRFEFSTLRTAHTHTLDKDLHGADEVIKFTVNAQHTIQRDRWDYTAFSILNMKGHNTFHDYSIQAHRVLTLPEEW